MEEREIIISDLSSFFSIFLFGTNRGGQTLKRTGSTDHRTATNLRTNQDKPLTQTKS